MEGIESIHLNTNNPDKVTSLEANGIRVERVPSRTITNPHNVDYLLTKFRTLGHAGLEGALQTQEIVEEHGPDLEEVIASAGIAERPTGASRPEVLANLDPAKTLLIIDLDGVLEFSHGVPGEARALLERLRAAGYTIRFLTNDGINSRTSRRAESASAGIELDIDELYTASHLTARYVLEHRLAPILPLLGEPALEEFSGIELSETDPAAVVIGDWFPHYDYERLKLAHAALEGGAELDRHAPEAHLADRRATGDRRRLLGRRSRVLRPASGPASSASPARSPTRRCCRTRGSTPRTPS